MRSFPGLVSVGTALLAGGLFLPATSAQGARRPPNIVVILADDLGYADVGFQGCKDIPTPHLDQLAREGIRCTNGYVSHPFCSPTRAGLMTGRYQQRFGHENNPVFDPKDMKLGLPLDQVTIADVLKSAGYATGAVGKWHLGAAPPFHPNQRGFTEFFGFPGGGHVYLPGAKGGLEYSVPLQHNGKPVEWKEGEYLTDVLSREAAAFIERHRAKPFMLYLAYNAPHTPLQAPPKYLDRFAGIKDDKRRPYAAMISAMDDGIGRVLAKLRELDLERETVVFFLSDNGGPPAANGSQNTPLRDGKGTVFEGGIRVPFVVRWTGRLKPGTYDEPVICLDILPTAAALAGAKLPAKHPLDGVNLMPHLLGEKKGPPHEVLFWRAGGGDRWAVRQGRYKLLAVAGGKPQLYDLRNDITESKDLAAAQPERVAALQKLYGSWNAELTAPLWQNPQMKPKPPVKPE